MACEINGDTIKKGITNLLTKDLKQAGYFTQKGEDFTIDKAQHFEAQTLIGILNRRFSQEVIKKVDDTTYRISIPDSLIKDYFVNTKEGQNVVTIVGLYGDFKIEPDSWNHDTMFSYLNYPEITEMTNDKLKGFLKSLNPKFRVEEIDNLSVAGVSQIKDFLIQVRTLSKFSAMPEEVAHTFMELLPDEHPLKTEMLENITSFPIYSQTLVKYKDLYLTPEGNPDYNKIKHEAAAKLVSEYITALSTGEKDRVEALTKTKQNFIQRWFGKLLKWLGLGMRDHTQSYADIAGIILSGENKEQLKTPEQISDISYTDSYFFKMSEEEIYDNATKIISNPPPKLLETITKFSREFRHQFNRILKDDDFKALDNELKRDAKGEIGKFNRLAEIGNLLSASGMDLNDTLNVDSFHRGMKQFLEGIDRLEILSDSILKVINNKEKAKDFDEAIKNIKELELYASIYETFRNLISGDLVNELVASGIGQDVVTSVRKTQDGFTDVNNYILSKHRHNLFLAFKHTMSPATAAAAASFEKSLEEAKKVGNKAIIAHWEKRITDLIPKDEDIMNMLSGRGRDINGYAIGGHLLNAAVINGDIYIASIAKYIQDKVNRYQQVAKETNLSLLHNINPITKALNEPSHITGRYITFSDTVIDADTGKERKVLTWLNPFKDIQPVVMKHRIAMKEALTKFLETDKNDKVARDAAKEEYNTKRRAYSDFRQKFYHRPYVKEYYEFRKKYEEDPTFTNAMAEYKIHSDLIQATEDLLNLEPENDEQWDDLALLKRERSNLLSETDLDGDDKVGEDLKSAKALKAYFDDASKFREFDEAQTERTFGIYRNRYEQKLDFALQAIRDSNPNTIEEAEKKLKELMKDNRIRIVPSYNDEIEDNVAGIDYKALKKVMMTRWTGNNVSIQKSDQFYIDEKIIRDKLDELQKKGELTPLEEELGETYKLLSNILRGSRDESGEINPASLTDEQKDLVLDIEDRLEDLKAERPRTGVSIQDMSPEDQAQYQSLTQTMADPSVPGTKKRNSMSQRTRILNKYKKTGNTKMVKELVNLLGSLTEKVPTKYYWDKMVPFIQSISEFARDYQTRDVDPAEKKAALEMTRLFTQIVDSEDYDILDFTIMTSDMFGGKDGFLDWLKVNDAKKHQWFTNNHIAKAVFDHINGKYTKLPFVRTALYTLSLPKRAEHGKIVYNRRFTKNRVKDEYRTGYDPTTKKVDLKVGIHISNREDDGYQEFLPLRPEDGAPADSPFINKAYYKLRDSKDSKDKLRFQYMQMLMDTHLKHQDMLPSRLRSWMKVPVMELSHIEGLKHIPTVVAEKFDKVKSTFKKNQAGDAQAQLEGQDTIQDTDEQEYVLSAISDKMPKLGMSQRLPIERVSTDLLKSVEEFVFNSNEFTARTEVHPVVKALLRVMGDNNDRKNMGNKERSKIFEKMFSQLVLQEIPDTAFNSKAIRRISSFLTGNTALRLVADLPGGAVNYLSAVIQDVIESSAGKYLNLAELAKGKQLAFNVVTSLTADYGKKAGLSYNTLLFDYFDFLQGEFQEDLLDRSSSMDKRASVRKLLMVPRKAGEYMAQTAIGMGMLHRNRAINSIDGKSYPIHQIYKVENNLLKLKEGFPQEWNPLDGDKFHKLKELINRVNLELHGNYAKISQTEASRYAIGKLAENLKRWFMPAIQRRFGRATLDITFEEMNEGYYRTGGRAAVNIFKNLLTLDFGGAKDWMHLFMQNPGYRQNLQRLAAESVQAMLLLLVFSVLLGYSGNRKNQDLKTNSWLQNMAILLALRGYSETTAYIPIPPFGFQEMKRNVLSPFSLPADSVSNMAAMGELGLYQVAYWFGVDDLFGQNLKQNLYYQKDSGFFYSQKGGSKLLKYFLKTLGYTGYTFEPRPYIQNFNNLQNRLK